MLISCGKSLQERIQEKEFLDCHISINPLERLKFSLFKNKWKFLGFYYSGKGRTVEDRMGLLENFFLTNGDSILEVDDCLLDGEGFSKDELLSRYYLSFNYVSKHYYLFIGNPEQIKLKIKQIRILRNGKEIILYPQKMEFMNTENRIYPNLSKFMKNGNLDSELAEEYENTVDAYEEYDPSKLHR